MTFKLTWLSLVVFALCLTAYIFFHDKTVYHIDKVGSGQKFPWFVFLESMLLGAMFRKGDHYLRARCFRPVRDTFFVLLFAGGYVAVRSLLKMGRIPEEYQILSPICLFLLTAALFWSASSLDHALEGWRGSNRWAGRVVETISNLTLEIYLVQYAVIALVLRGPKIPFPLNWLVCVAAILLEAALVHWVSFRAAAPLIRELKRQ